MYVFYKFVIANYIYIVIKYFRRILGGITYDRIKSYRSVLRQNLALDS